MALDPREAEFMAREAESLARGCCPYTGHRLTVHGNVQLPEGTLSCGICDCFGYDPSEVGV